MWKRIPTAYCASKHVLEKKLLQMRQYGMTLPPSTGDLGVDLYILLWVATRVNQTPWLPRPGNVQSHLQTHSCELSVKYAQAMLSGRTRVRLGRRPPQVPIILPTGLRLLATARRYSKFGRVIWGLTIDGLDCSSAPRWCTPTATDRKGKSGPNAKALLRGGYARLADQVGGLPHPEFSEVLMGLPEGLSDYEPLETERFQRWLQSFRRFVLTKELSFNGPNLAYNPRRRRHNAL